MRNEMTTGSDVSITMRLCPTFRQLNTKKNYPQIYKLGFCILPETNSSTQNFPIISSLYPSKTKQSQFGNPTFRFQNSIAKFPTYFTMVKFASSDDRQIPVKLEIEDSLEDENGPFSKRQNHFPAHVQSTTGNSLFPAQPSQCNPLDEPSPLGLRLRKSPSLLELIQMRLSQGSSSTVRPTPSDVFNTREKANTKNSTAATDKLKASNFTASLLRMGSWEYISKYEGDLVAKCYFAKHKLVWEVLDGGLKSKIEIQWSDIMGLKADIPDDAPATLIVVLSRQPLFFREINPQPRKHTLWQATTDFTNDQASLHRKNFLEIPNGLLNKHFEKLIQCDMRLNFLSQQPETILESPYFESQPSLLDEINEPKSHRLNKKETSKGTNMSIFEDIATPSASQSSTISIKQEDALHGSTEILSREICSPSSVMDARVIEASTSTNSGKLKNPKNFKQLIMQGIRPSMSKSDHVNHIGSCISSENLSFLENESESQKILEDIASHHLGDFQFIPCSDEKYLMSRVNSLCSLIQKEDSVTPTIEEGKADTTTIAPEGVSRDVSTCKRVPSIPRIDSFGDLLTQLPRIASLPKFLFDISEDGDNQAR